jgi:hypothetical protein
LEPHAVLDLNLGASRSLLGGVIEWPIHGLRHSPEADTSGWFVWTGELSEADDFFVPWHGRHLAEKIPELVDVLRLEPGTRFIYAPDYLDVWQDSTLI